MGSRAIRFASLAAALSLISLAACSSGPGALPKPPDITPATTTTTQFDYSDVGLRAVSGRIPTTTVPFGPGHATVKGTVVGDGGVIAGASVIVERVVDGNSSRQVLVTADDGTWSLPNVLGGRYRVRAFKQPDLAQTSVSGVFVGQSETKQIELRVKTVGGLSVSAAYAPDPPQLNRSTQLVVLVSEKVVDAAGVVRSSPIANTAVDLVGSAAWRVESVNPTVTDQNGHADWLLRCRQAGHNPLAVTIGSESIPLEVKDCVDATVESTTTTTAVTPTTI